MDPQATALLLIEFQNDFTADGGAQHGAVREVMARTDMLAHAHAVAEGARRRGVAVLHAPIAFADGYPEIPREPYGILAGATLAIAGFLTNCCVESTMRSAYERGYRVVTLTDCVATTGMAEQDASIRNTFPMFSLPATHGAFLDGLEAPRSAR